MNLLLFEKLFANGLISAKSLERVKSAEANKLFPVHWELRTILYLGVLLLTGGLGILIYKNIDTIGHQAILAFFALLCAGCFYYCERKKHPYSPGKVQSPDSFFDYVLLTGCLTMLIFIGYLQAQYNVFGDRYGLASFIPMIILFFCAYYFDHLGVLTMAITNLGAWMGLAITPMKIFRGNNFADAELIFAGLVLGALLMLLSRLSTSRKIKPHFSFTYLNFGMNILFISCLAGMFRYGLIYFVWLLPLAALVIYFYKRAMALRSFYIVLMLTVYAYVGISYALIRLLTMGDVFEVYYLILLYFIASAVYVSLFLIRTNKKIKANDSL